MVINDIYNDIVAAVLDNVTITAWTQTNYGKDHAVLNVNAQDPPVEAASPYVVISANSKKVGHGEEVGGKKRSSFLVYCFLHDRTESARSTGNLTEYSGTKNLESFRKLVETAIASVFVGNILIAEIDIKYDLISYPWFSCEQVLQLTESILLMGGGALT